MHDVDLAVSDGERRRPDRGLHPADLRGGEPVNAFDDQLPGEERFRRSNRRLGRRRRRMMTIVIAVRRDSVNQTDGDDAAEQRPGQPAGTPTREGHLGSVSPNPVKDAALPTRGVDLAFC